MQVFAKIKAPVLGRGKIKIVLTKAFLRTKPADRMTVINQIMKAMRHEYDRAQHEDRIEKVHEDARNADRIQVRA